MATEINIIQVLPNANLMFSITVIINKKRERNTAIYKYTRKHQVNVCFKGSVEITTQEHRQSMSGEMKCQIEGNIKIRFIESLFLTNIQHKQSINKTSTANNVYMNGHQL